MSPNLVKQSVLVPKEESSSGSDMEFHGSQRSQRKSVMRKVKSFVRRMLPSRRRHKPVGANSASPWDALLPHTQSLLPEGAQERPPPRLPSTPRTRKRSQNGNRGLGLVRGSAKRSDETGVACPGSLSGMQTPRPYPVLLSQYLLFRKIPK